MQLGLCQCITPTGVPYVTNRGGPLVGEELLLLQGIPADDLILTKESDENLKDLAGNAMSTTVVGAAVLSALIVGQKSISARPKEAEDVSLIPSLVPRPLNPPSDIAIVKSMGVYCDARLDLGPKPFKDMQEWADFLEAASSSSRMCTSEGPEECLPVKSLMVCQECGKTASRSCALPPRPFERHSFVDMPESFSRFQPGCFRTTLIWHLPMQVYFSGLAIESSSINRPSDVTEEDWCRWITRLNALRDGDRARTFRFNRLHRSHIWTAHFASCANCRLECRIQRDRVTWLLFLDDTDGSGLSIADELRHPVARMIVSPSLNALPCTLLHGQWELCLPTLSTVSLVIEGSGRLVDSWRNSLGLKNGFENEVQHQILNVKIESNEDVDPSLKSCIEGSYSLLRDCGGACGSLRKKSKREGQKGDDVFFFLESGRKSIVEDDTFVFASASHRSSYQEYREIFLEVDPKAQYRPTFCSSETCKIKEVVEALIHGRWLRASHLKLVSADLDFHVSLPKQVDTGPMTVPVQTGSWKTCPLLTACRLPLEAAHPLSQHRQPEFDLNLQKSQHVMSSVAFATSRFSLPSNGAWCELDRCNMEQEDGEDIVCGTCAPMKPPTVFKAVSRGKKVEYLPIEDMERAGIYERSVKKRPQPWIVRFSQSHYENENGLHMAIACNPVSLSLLAFGRLPAGSTSRRSMIDSSLDPKDSHAKYDWRVVAHEEKSVGHFPKLTFTSNKQDSEASQPPCFKHPLRKEQLRSLQWMLHQEASSEPFYEEEVEEAILPSINWRAEGRATRPIIVRGGIIADEVRGFRSHVV